MNIYEEYALIDAEIKALTSKKEAIRVSILTEIIDSGESKKATPIGTFTVAKLKTWTMPGYIIEMREDLKEAEEKAKSTEEATYVENESLKFTPIKL